MNIQLLIGIFIPLLGTTLGAGMVFFLKDGMSERVTKILTGFASGIMIAASFWSLLTPALDLSSDLGKLSFIPTGIGFLLGMLFLLVLDSITPHMHLDQTEEGPSNHRLKKTTKMVLAVTLHNIPEGMAVGVVFAGWLTGNQSISLASAFILALGIAIQNFPEGAIVSMPLLSEGVPKSKTFFYGFLSGLVEPIGSIITILFASLITPLLPYFLSFAAGAMFYVVIEELIPDMSKGDHSNLGTISFALGFVLMMILDVALG